MQNITKRCPETIGVGILGLADNWLLSGNNWRAMQDTHIIGNQSLRMLVDNGGRCRIEPTFRSEGRKDIQTTLIARSLPDKQLLLEEVCSPCQIDENQCNPPLCLKNGLLVISTWRVDYHVLNGLAQRAVERLLCQ